MWGSSAITEPTLIRRFGLMSDLQGLITESTSPTFQHVIIPVSPPPFSPQQQRRKEKEAIPIRGVSCPRLQVRQKEDRCRSNAMTSVTECFSPFGR